MQGQRTLLAMVLVGAAITCGSAQAASEQEIRACQESSMNPLVVSQCIQKLKSKAYMLEEGRCRKSLKCWGERYSDSAQKNCAVGFTRAARWDSNWSSIWDDQTLDHVRWQSRGEGVLQYYRDESGVRLSCAFNPQLPEHVQVQYGPAQGAIGIALGD